MASFYGTATLCEVKYNPIKEEHSTPYRISCWSAGARDNGSLTSEIPTFSLPSSCSVSYCEYLRSLYEDKTAGSSKGTGYASSSSSSGNQSTASHGIVYASNSYAAKYGHIDRRPKTAITLRPKSTYLLPQQQKSLPSLLQQDEEEREKSDDEFSYFEDRIVWVDALNKWVPEQQLHPRPYLHFVGTAPTVAKLYTTLRESSGDEHGVILQKECNRYNRHMESYKSSGFTDHPLHPDYSYTNRIMNLKRREEMRRKAEELLEQRRQRKSHSSPTHSLLSERRQKVRFHVPDKSEVSSVETPVPVMEKSDRVATPEEEEPEESAKSDEMDAADEVFLAQSTSEITATVPSTKDDDSDILPISPQSEVAIDSFRFNGDKKEELEDTPVTLPPVIEGEVSPKKKVKEIEVFVDYGECLDKTCQTDKDIMGEPEVIDLPSVKLPKNLSNNTTDIKKKKAMKVRVKPQPPPKAPAKPSKPLVKVSSKTSKKSITAIHDKSEEGLKNIPTVGDTKTGPLSLVSSGRARTPVEKKVLIASSERRHSIVRKERYELRRLLRERSQGTPSPEPRSPSPPLVDEEPEPTETDIAPVLDTEIPKTHACVDEPPLPDAFTKKEKQHSQSRRGTLVTLPQFRKQKLKRFQFGRDTTYEDEVRKFELAERRRQKQMEMLEKLKSKRQQHELENGDDDESPNFEDYGFLAKYCIFDKGHLQMYKHTFDIVDDENKGWLQPIEVMMALRGVNNKLTDAEEEYLYRILELTGYSITKGADFKLFSVLAALSQKISSLDSWMRNQIGKMDFQMLEMKTFMCKTLWECNVDPETNKIPLDQLCVELRAGGISLEHENEVRQTLSHIQSLDLLDFLTYIPLFIMIHKSVVDNPLDTRRDK